MDLSATLVVLISACAETAFDDVRLDVSAGSSRDATITNDDATVDCNAS
jgi:hypothetical protein